ncbi:MAG: hypothetical protein WBC91_03325 [Phototrophicaceae bacterium]
MSDKRTGKKQKKVHPKVTEDSTNSITQAPMIPPKKTKKPSKG